MIDQLRTMLEEQIRERGVAPHPDAVAPILAGRLDPTARDSVNRHGETITAEFRSLESALSYYALEGLCITLTPLGMMAAAYLCLQVLSGDHPEMPEADRAKLDVWNELTPFQALVCEPHEGHNHEGLTAAEECRRALWHLEQAYTAAVSQVPA